MKEIEESLAYLQQSGILPNSNNRHAICNKHGLNFKTVAMAFNDEDAACVWIILTNGT